FYISVGLKDKDRTLKELFLKLNPSPAIVFCNTKKMVDSLCDKLVKEGINAVKIHGDMPQPERKRIMDEVKSGKSGLLIATDVAARGIDISDVEAVFNYDIPKQTEWYTHRIGRTGRAGKTGVAYSLVNTVYQETQLKKIVAETGDKIKEYYTSYSKDRRSAMPEEKSKKQATKQRGRSRYSSGKGEKRYGVSIFEDEKGKKKKPFRAEKSSFKAGKPSYKKGRPSQKTEYGYKKPVHKQGYGKKK
ncbi:MAG: C-terminal helicase domain-containing protein, partial [Clostridia bacterium]|nr:C-terminal helicase domain-containing protein [Clostridia bacterium]